MQTIYFSPHLDDAMLSCGGLIWQQVQGGRLVQVWTLCAGDPAGPLSTFARQLHQRWDLGDNPAALRRQEDILACRHLGVGYRHLPIPDCIYRLHPKTAEPLYASEQALFGDLDKAEEGEIEKWAGKISAMIPPDVSLVCPLAIGGHVDHNLTRRVLEQSGRPLLYYADYPYAAGQDRSWKAMVPKGYRLEVQVISEYALRIWQEGINAYRSQISTFWPDDRAMEQAIERYWTKWGGIPLWKPGV